MKMINNLLLIINYIIIMLLLLCGGEVDHISRKHCLARTLHCYGQEEDALGQELRPRPFQLLLLRWNHLKIDRIMIYDSRCCSSNNNNSTCVVLLLARSTCGYYRLSISFLLHSYEGLKYPSHLDGACICKKRYSVGELYRSSCNISNRFLLLLLIIMHKNKKWLLVS